VGISQYSFLKGMYRCVHWRHCHGLQRQTGLCTEVSNSFNVEDSSQGGPSEKLLQDGRTALTGCTS